jgi:hypothetical protein
MEQVWAVISQALQTYDERNGQIFAIEVLGSSIQQRRKLNVSKMIKINKNINGFINVLCLIQTLYVSVTWSIIQWSENKQTKRII